MNKCDQCWDRVRKVHRQKSRGVVIYQMCSACEDAVFKQAAVFAKEEKLKKSLKGVK